MSIAFLNGLPQGVTARTIHEVLHASGQLTTQHDLRDERFAPCVGCFECWTHHPGRCRAHDAANEVMPDFIGANAVFFATKLRFGCWDPITKVALDKSIGLLSPFFTTVHGETHHRPRYERYPRWAVVAETSSRTTEAEKRCFRSLVARNSLNLQHLSPFVGFVPEAADAPTVRAVVEEGLAAMGHERPPAEFPALAPFVHPTRSVGVAQRSDRPRRALLWVGSAKPSGQSASEKLGRFLLEELGAKGWECRVVHVASTVKLGRAGAPKLVEAVGWADLVVLATPVYVDCLPSLVLAGLGHVVDANLASPPALLPIVQCGFPELSHTVLALEVAAFAAAEAGMPWAGHLALGGGGTIGDRPLRDAGGSVFHQRNALQATAAALDEGRPVTARITAEFAESPLPAGLYRLAGQFGWLGEALKHHALFDLWDRPFEAASAPKTTPDEPVAPE